MVSKAPSGESIFKTTPLTSNLPVYVARRLDKYNQEVFQAYRDCVLAFCHNLKFDAEEFLLPLSLVDYSCKNVESTCENKGEFYAALKRLTIVSKTRSPFAALAGRPDCDFRDADDLCNSVRKQVCLETSMLSLVEFERVEVTKPPDNASDSERKAARLPLLYSWIPDFLNHGKLKRLHEYVHPNEVYDMVNWFVRSLRKVMYCAGVMQTQDAVFSGFEEKCKDLDKKLFKEKA